MHLNETWSKKRYEGLLTFALLGSPPVALVIAATVTALVVSLPVLLTPFPAIGDYLNHLARMHILAAYSASPELQANYTIRWLPSPYLGMDLIIPPLLHLVPIEVAGRFFLAMTLALWLVGCCAIYFSLFRKLSLWPLTACLVIYNYDLYLGFANYLFGVGVWLVAFALWIESSSWRRIWRVPLFIMLGLTVYLTHFMAVLGYGVTVAAYELGGWRREGPRSLRSLATQIAVAGSQFVIPLALIVSIPTGEGGGTTYYGGVNDKITALTSPTRFIDSHFDMPILAFLALVIVGGLILRILRLAPAMRLPLAFLALVALAMPNTLHGVWATDVRFPPVFVALLIASCEFDTTRAKMERAIFVAASCLLIGHVTSIYQAWQLPASRYAEFRSALPAIAKGSRLLVFVDAPGEDRRIMQRFSYYSHIAGLAVIDRGVFLPFLFKNPMMPVQASLRNRVIDTPHGSPIAVRDLWDGADVNKGPKMLDQRDNVARRNYWGDWPAHFDYVLGLNVSETTLLPPELSPIHTGSFFTIYKVADRSLIAAR